MVAMFNFDTMEWEKVDGDEAAAALELVASTDTIAGSDMTPEELLATLLDNGDYWY